jgi:hypothetical protein
MRSTYSEFSEKMDRLDSDYAKKLEEQNKRFFPSKPDDSYSAEMREHYEKYEKLLREHTETYNKRMKDHSDRFRAKYKEKFEQPPPEQQQQPQTQQQQQQ